MSSPQVVTRPGQPYVGVRDSVTITTIGRLADRIPQLIGWLGERGSAPAGAPFLRYRVIDMAGRIEVEAGVPVAVPVDGDGEVFAAELPAGRYATVTHVGHPDGLLDATTALLAWADAQGLAWDVHGSPDGDVWGCRLEVFNTNPMEQPDPSRWETDLVFKLA
jgi:RNA polymerase sigma-70 factor (ECF subfamily)